MSGTILEIPVEEGDQVIQSNNFNDGTTIATIADMVPLVNDNRIIVDMGVRLLFETNLYGLNALLDNIRFFNYPSSVDLSFKLSPILMLPGLWENPEKP